MDFHHQPQFNRQARSWNGKVSLRLPVDPWQLCINLNGISLSPNHLHAYWDLDNCGFDLEESDLQQLFLIGQTYSLQINWKSDFLEVPVIDAKLEQMQLAHHRNSLTFEFCRPCLEVEEYFIEEKSEL